MSYDGMITTTGLCMVHLLGSIGIAASSAEMGTDRDRPLADISDGVREIGSVTLHCMYSYCIIAQHRITNTVLVQCIMAIECEMLIDSAFHRPTTFPDPQATAHADPCTTRPHTYNHGVQCLLLCWSRPWTMLVLGNDLDEALYTRDGSASLRTDLRT